MKEILEALQQHVEAGQLVALATVVEVRGASPAQVGFKLLARPDGSAGGNKSRRSRRSRR
jgi:xanthine/CO dehydrogenase XdhC/CoxF family maturation factor